MNRRNWFLSSGAVVLSAAGSAVLAQDMAHDHTHMHMDMPSGAPLDSLIAATSD